MPLPDLFDEGRHTYVADFLQIGTVDSSDLDRTKRIAAFSRLGRQHFQHRAIHHFTRMVAPLSDLDKATVGVEREIELQASWVEAACDARDSKAIDVVEQAEAEFDEYMSVENRRAALADNSRTHIFTSHAHREIKARYVKPR
jgi:hypothetical protein